VCVAIPKNKAIRPMLGGGFMPVNDSNEKKLKSCNGRAMSDRTNG